MSMNVEVIHHQDKDNQASSVATIDYEPGSVMVFYRGGVENFDNLDFAIKWLMGFGYVKLSQKSS